MTIIMDDDQVPAPTANKQTKKERKDASTAERVREEDISSGTNEMKKKEAEVLSSEREGGGKKKRKGRKTPTKKQKKGQKKCWVRLFWTPEKNSSFLEFDV